MLSYLNVRIMYADDVKLFSKLIILAIFIVLERYIHSWTDDIDLYLLDDKRKVMSSAI